MATWQLQDAEAHLDAVIAAAKLSGTQIIVREGVQEAAVVSMEEWERLNSRKPTFLEVLQSGPQGDLNIPPRGSVQVRKPVSVKTRKPNDV